MTTLPWIAPYRLIDGADARYLVLCCHASNAMPPEYDQLGMCNADLERHVAWDPGAGGVALALAERLNCPLVLGGISRLMVDLNRGPDNSELILAESDNTWVPGNLKISDEERKRRLSLYHRPYHQCIESHLDARDGQQPLVIAIHSFNPSLNGVDRPWPVGLLWKEPGWPHLEVLAFLQSQGLNVGENQPYEGRVAMGYTLEHHALTRGLPYLMVELRNDGLVSPAQQQQWGQLLFAALRSMPGPPAS